MINNMIDYYETDNYIYTHGFIPVNGFCNPYYNENCTHDPEWRNSSEKKLKNFRWINGMEINMNHNIGEPNKKIVIGHY